MTTKLHEKLKLETSKRIQKGVLFQLAVIAFLALSFGNRKPQTPNFLLILFLSAIFAGLRGVIVFFAGKHRDKLLRIFPYQMALTLLSALSYGVLAADSIFYFNKVNSQVFACLFSLVGLMTAVISSLAAAPIIQRWYFVFSGGPLAYACFSGPNRELFVEPGFSFLVYIVYLFVVSYGIRKDLIYSYHNEIQSDEQSKMLNQVIQSMPGFVGMRSEKGEWTVTNEDFQKFKATPEFLNLLQQFESDSGEKMTREISMQAFDQTHNAVVSLRKYHENELLVIGIPSDELVSTREQLEQQRAKSEVAARLATLGEMAGGIAHEINNPLAVIIASSNRIQTLLDENTANPERIQLLNSKIAKTGLRIAKTVTALRKLTRDSRNEKEEIFELSPVIAEVVELCQERFEASGVTLLISESPEVDAKILGSSVQIGQILLNLLSNALEASKKSEGSYVQIKVCEIGSQIKIEVVDNGSGVNLDISEKIFQPFFTTKEVGTGTGLGLSISHSIARNHRGELRLSNYSPTTFELILPKADSVELLGQQPKEPHHPLT